MVMLAGMWYSIISWTAILANLSMYCCLVCLTGEAANRLAVKATPKQDRIHSLK
jgi:hypothetical protein